MPAPIAPLIEAAALWPTRGPLLGLDLGTKTIGVAVSDPDRRLATGVETISRTAFTADAARLMVLAAERKACGLVLGLPINMDGSEGPRAQATRAFARNLARMTDMPIALWDERLSTSAVERELIAQDVSRAKRAKVIDQHAAIFILQGALDRLTTLAPERRLSMLVIATALLPVFLLMILGFVLKRGLIDQPTFWNGLERLVYYILFPALLIDTLARAKFANVPIAGVGGALLLAVLVMSTLCWALRRPLAAWWNVDGPAFSSLFQGATRWQTFVALSVAGNLYGETGIALASVAMVAMIPLLNIFAVMVLARYAAPQRLKWPAMLAAIGQNPLIWSCVIGIALNLSGLVLPVWLHEFLDSLGRCCLATGLLVVGAGLQIETLRRPQPVAWLTVGLKLLVMPLVALSLAMAFGVTGVPLAVVACCASVPSASNGYVLAKQMGGDAPLLAQILMLQTVIAALTMPLVIAWATGGG